MELRMVAISTGTGSVTIQARWRKTDEWHQESISETRFKYFFKTHFPNHYKFYEMAKENEFKEMKENGLEGFAYNSLNCADWFYNFGETNDMRRKGEAYIFEE